MDSRGNNIDNLDVLKVKRHIKNSGRCKSKSSSRSKGARGGAFAGKNCIYATSAKECRAAGNSNP